MKTIGLGLGFGWHAIGVGVALAATACTVNTSDGPSQGTAPRPDAGNSLGIAVGRNTGGTLPASSDGGGSLPPTNQGPSACAADPSDDACSTCLKTSCCDTFSACLGDTACDNLVQCDNGCNGGDTACVDQCTSTYSAGQSAALALVNCEQASCNAACSGTSAPPPSTGQGACLPDTAVPAGAPDCAGLTNTPAEHDCPFGSPDPSCVPAPNGSTNVFCCPSSVSLPQSGSPAPGSSGSGAYVDPQVVGVWENSHSIGVDYTNGSGSYSSPSGNKAIFQFSTDGQYVFEVFEQSSLYSCTMAVLGRETGTASFHGNDFTLSPGTATITSQDSCNVSNNYKKPWQSRLDGPFEYTWSVGDDPNGSGRRVLSMTRLGDGVMETLLEQPSQ